MASLIASSNRGLSSLVDTVSTTAETATKLVVTASRAVDMLDAKAKVMHHSVVEAATIDMAVNQQQVIQDRAADLTEREEARTRRMFPDVPFNRQQAYSKYISTITKALEEASKDPN